MFSPIVVVSIVSALVSLNVTDTASPGGYNTEEACITRLTELVQSVAAIQSQIPSVQMRVTTAVCRKK